MNKTCNPAIKTPLEDTKNISCSKNVFKARTIRSFVIRASRITAAQSAQLTIDNPYLFQLSLQASENDKQALMAWVQQSINNVFAQTMPLLALDIGFGMGDSTVPLALAYPKQMWLAVDVHPPGIGRLLHLIKQADVHNIRVIAGDVLDVLAALPNNSVSLCKTFFPDPWPKKRHHKRRLLQNIFADLLAEKMAVDSIWHIATDIDDYGEQIRNMLVQHSSWEVFSYHVNKHFDEIEPTTLDDHRLIRPPTKFANRAILQGRLVHTLGVIRKL